MEKEWPRVGEWWRTTREKSPFEELDLAKVVSFGPRSILQHR